MVININLDNYYVPSATVLWNQGYGIINYAMSKWWTDNRYKSFSVSRALEMIIEAEHPTISIVIHPMHMRIEIPDDVYLLTQLKYAEYTRNIEDYFIAA